MTKISQINKINRFKEPLESGIFCDIMWSDPTTEHEYFSENVNRGCSVFYGKQSIKKFLKSNNLKAIIRAHEVQYEGFKMYNFGDSFP